MNNPGGKGDKRRPTQVSREEEALRWAIWRETDEEKKAQLMADLEHLRETERKWREMRKSLAHLWGDGS